MSLSPGGIHGSVVSSSLDRSVKVWDVATGRCKRDFVMPTFAQSIAVSSDARRVFAACGDQRAYMMSVDEETSPLRFEGHSGPLLSAALSHDNQTLVTCAQGDAVRIWDVGTRQCVRHLDSCFQNSAILGVKVCHRTDSATPLPEFRPLQRVVAADVPASVPVFARRAADLEWEDDSLDRLIDEGADALETGGELATLKGRVVDLEAEQSRWAAATSSLVDMISGLQDPTREKEDVKVSMDVESEPVEEEPVVADPVETKKARKSKNKSRGKRKRQA